MTVETFKELPEDEKVARFVTLQETCSQQLAATDAITKLISPPKVERAKPVRKRRLGNKGCYTMEENIEALQAMDDAEELKQSAKDDDAAFYKPIKDLFIRLGYMPINETRVNIAPMKSFIKINHIPTGTTRLSTMKKMELAAAVKAFIATPPAAGFLPAPVAELAIVDAAAAATVAAPAQ